MKQNEKKVTNNCMRKISSLRNYMTLILAEEFALLGLISVSVYLVI